MMLKQYVSILICVLLGGSVHGCSDTGGPQAQAAGLAGTNNLRGAIITVVDNERIWSLNARTGKFSPYESMTIDEKVPGFDEQREITIYPNSGEQNGVIYTIKKCRNKGDAFFDDFDSCVAVFDSAEVYKTGIIVPDDIVGFAQLSPNGRFIVLEQSPDDLTNLATTFRLYRVIPDGLSTEFDSLRFEAGADPVAHDWGPNGEIYYSGPFFAGESVPQVPVINITEPESLITARTITLPAQYSNYAVNSIDVSVDGQKLLLGLRIVGELVRIVTIHVLDITTGVITRPVMDINEIGNPSEMRSASNPRWSPDEKWILFSYGSLSGPTVNVSRAPDLVAIPSSSDQLIVNYDNLGITPNAIPIIHNEPDLNNIDNTNFTQGWLYDRAYWIQ